MVQDLEEINNINNNNNILFNEGKHSIFSFFCASFWLWMTFKVIHKKKPTTTYYSSLYAFFFYFEIKERHIGNRNVKREKNICELIMLRLFHKTIKQNCRWSKNKKTIGLLLLWLLFFFLFYSNRWIINIIITTTTTSK
jgi:hypothetical protein